MANIVKKIPASEDGSGMRILTKSGAEWRITQNTKKKKHTLWRCVNGGFEKIAVADSPLALHKYYEE